MMFSTLIIDDEALARQGLAVRLQAYPEINIIQECCNGREAIAAIKALQPKLIFLDIQMPGLNGFQVLEQLIAEDIPLPLIIFVTAFEHYAIKAFEVHAIDYLLKPTDEVRLAQAIDKIRDKQQQDSNNRDKLKLIELVSAVTGNEHTDILAKLAQGDELTLEQYSDVLAIKDGGMLTRVPVKDIWWIDAAGDYMCVFTKEHTHILRRTMKELEQALDTRKFIRCHRSIIVNKDYIKQYCNNLNGESYLIMQNDKELKVSRSYKERVKKAIKQ